MGTLAWLGLLFILVVSFFMVIKFMLYVAPMILCFFIGGGAIYMGSSLEGLAGMAFIFIGITVFSSGFAVAKSALDDLKEGSVKEVDGINDDFKKDGLKSFDDIKHVA